MLGPYCHSISCMSCIFLLYSPFGVCRVPLIYSEFWCVVWGVLLENWFLEPVLCLRLFACGFSVSSSSLLGLGDAGGDGVGGEPSLLGITGSVGMCGLSLTST